MGSTITVSISHQQADQILADCFSLLRSYEHRFSANDSSSELMEVNQKAGIEPVKVHPDLFSLIARSVHLSKLGELVFQMLGSLIK